MFGELRTPAVPGALGLDETNFVRNPGILVADDTEAILGLLKFELEAYGFAVWLAVDGHDALECYSHHADEIDLVLLDVQMPGLDGPSTLAALRQLNPDLPACFMTGGSGDWTDEELSACGALSVFHKPFRLGEIARFLERLLRFPDPLTVLSATDTSESM
jgi:CheY-like chemotaxis protein